MSDPTYEDLRAENERLRKQLRREQIIASALANVSHVIDDTQSGANVIHAEDCPACAASQRIDAALALSLDDIKLAPEEGTHG